jgi:hypothetical protein
MHTRYTPTLLLVALLFSPFVLSAQDPGLSDILRKHRRAQADVTKLYGADSLRLKGVTIQQGQTYDFTLFKKSPDLLRYEISYKERNFVIIYDGKRGYYWSPDEPDRPVQVASGMQDLLLRQEACFDGPLLNAGARGFTMNYKGLYELPDLPNPVHYIELRGTRGEGLMDVFLDSVSYLEVMRTFRPTEEDTPLVTRFSDFRTVEGFTIPFRIDNSYHDQALSQTRVIEADVNAGILGFFFELPKDKR